MSRKSLPSYRLHKASVQAIVVLSGKMVYLGKFGSKPSHRAYDRAVAEWLARRRQPDLRPVDGYRTITELIAAFWRHAQQHYRRADGKPTGELGPLKSALRILRQTYGTERVDQFGPLKLQALRERMIAAGWARTTINGQVRRVIRVFRWGVAQEIVPGNVPTALREVAGLERGRTVARETAGVKPVSDEVFQATLPHLPAVVADLLRLMRRTGMRPDEACTIRPGDIDRTGDVWLYRPRAHKTERHGIDRVVPIGPAGQAVLQPYLLRAADAFCFQPAESESRRLVAVHAARTTPLHYGNRPGTNRKKRGRKFCERYSAGSLHKAVERACEIAFEMPTALRVIPKSVQGPEREKLKKAAREWREQHGWAPNQLRHTYGTAVRRDYGLEAAQVLLGHREADTTQIYAEANVRKAISVAREVG